MSQQPIWHRDVPPNSYQEGRDLVLGRYCAFSHHDRIIIHHMPTADDLAARAKLFSTQERTRS